MNGKVFSENQMIMPVTLLIAVVITFVGLLIFTIYMISIDDSIAADSIEGITMIASLAIIVVVMFILGFIKMHTTVTNESLTVGMLKGRSIPLREIEKVTQEEFTFKDFLGYGIRVGKKGVGYIAAGTNKGIRIHLKGGKSFLISTKRPFEFENAMRTAMRTAK
jgi:hypothetical protein